jgi:hypothetical protein
MPPPRNVNSATVKHKLPSESVVQSILSNLKKPFECTKRTFIACRLLTEVLPMSV